jgi:hypothetical protein
VNVCIGESVKSVYEIVFREHQNGAMDRQINELQLKPAKITARQTVNEPQLKTGVENDRHTDCK